MPQHERTDVFDPDPAGGGLTRRRALGLALAAGAGALAAACGEAEPVEILLPPRDAEQRTAAAPDQLWSDAPSFIFLQSSLGVVPDSQGSFAALRSPEALTTVQTFHDLATTKGVSQAQRDRGTDVYDLLYQGRIGLMLVPLSGN